MGQPLHDARSHQSWDEQGAYHTLLLALCTFLAFGVAVAQYEFGLMMETDMQRSICEWH